MLRHARHAAAALLALFLALATLFAGLSFRESSRVLTELRSHTDQITHTLEADMAPDFSTTVTDSEGNTTTVNTSVGSGTDPNGNAVPSTETFADGWARHLRRVRFVKGEADD